MKKSMFSPWYKAKQFRPKRPGWYDYCGAGLGEIRAYWSGHDWQYAKGGYLNIYVCSNDLWRGLSEKPV